VLHRLVQHMEKNKDINEIQNLGPNNME